MVIAGIACQRKIGRNSFAPMLFRYDVIYFKKYRG